MRADGGSNSGSLAPSRRCAPIDLAAVLLISCATALALRGHFIKPHIDFFDFYEAANAFQHGHLAPTLKRAPIYPAILAVGSWITDALVDTVRPPMQVFAEWLNAALLPVNAVLVWMLGRRWLRALEGDERIAAIAAIWFCCLPWGMYCTAHLLLEPLLVTVVLATVVLAGSARLWCAYFVASLAIMVRYDVAGLVVGLLIADILARRGVLRCIRFAIAAFAPLVAWLALTAFSWRAGDADHYVSQIGSHATFDPLWACRVVLDVLFNPSRLNLPTWIDVDESLVRGAIRGAILVAFIVGTAALARSRGVSRGAFSAGTCAAGYLAVHSVFPFQWERFGYPLSPLLLVVAVCGLQVIASWIGRSVSAHAQVCVCGAAGLFSAVPLIGAYSALPEWGISASWKLILVGALVASLVSALVAIITRPRSVGVAIAAGFTLSVCIAHTRDGVAMLGSGDEARHIVELAQWIAHNTTSTDIVVSPVDSVLRLYSDDPGGRFVPYSAIRANEWPEILEEFRSRDVRYLAWYDGVYSEHSQRLYRDNWRLERFSALDCGCDLPPLRLVWRSPTAPHAYVWERARSTATLPASR